MDGTVVLVRAVGLLSRHGIGMSGGGGGGENKRNFAM